MTREEENAKLRRSLSSFEIKETDGTVEEVMCNRLGIIGVMLVDISRSLAIIADKTESEDAIEARNRRVAE